MLSFEHVWIVACAISAFKIMFGNRDKMRKSTIRDVLVLTDGRKQFGTIASTFKAYSFLLAVGGMYPNPEVDKKRRNILILVMLSYAPALALMINDMRLRVLSADIENFIRQASVVIALFFVTLKQILSIYKGKELRALMDTINNDYEMFNHLPEDYQELVLKTIKKTKKFEKLWITMLGSAVFSFPMMAAVLTIYSQLFTDHPRRYMVHELVAPGILDDMKYATPYFEIFFVYCLYIIILLFQGYTGYDGIFSVCVLHAVLRLDMICHRLLHLLDDAHDLKVIKKRISKLVQKQCGTYKYIEDIQHTFGIWLASIFYVTVVQIVLSLIPGTTKGAHTNVMFYLFTSATVVQIYIPCYLTSEITIKAAKIATSAYGSAWENIPDIGARRSIAIMIARAQIPLYFKALKMLTFNMEMFVSIVQTAYSLFTLLRK